MLVPILDAPLPDVVGAGRLRVERDSEWSIDVAGTNLPLDPQTVEVHLGSAYRKLGVPSRAGLAAALGQDKPDPTTPHR